MDLHDSVIPENFQFGDGHAGQTCVFIGDVKMNLGYVIVAKETSDDESINGAGSPRTLKVVVGKYDFIIPTFQFDIDLMFQIDIIQIDDISIRIHDA